MDVHGGAAAESQEAAAAVIDGTAPVVAVAACVDQRANDVAAACRNKFQGRGKSAVIILTGPGKKLRFKLYIGRQPEPGRTGVIGAGRPLPQVVVLRRAPIIGKNNVIRNKTAVTRKIGGTEGRNGRAGAALMPVGQTAPLVQIPYASVSVILVATRVAPRLRSIQA